MEIKTWKAADDVLEAYAQTAQRLKKAEARRDLEIAKLRENWATEITGLEEELAAATKALKQFAGKNKEEFKPMPMGDGRSYIHAGVEMGFRRTPPAVRIEDEEKAVTYLYQYYQDEYVRTRFEPDREKIKAALIDGYERLIEALAAHGITLKQKDQFFLKLMAED